MRHGQHRLRGRQCLNVTQLSATVNHFHFFLNLFFLVNTTFNFFMTYFILLITVFFPLFTFTWIIYFKVFLPEFYFGGFLVSQNNAFISNEIYCKFWMYHVQRCKNVYILNLTKALTSLNMYKDTLYVCIPSRKLNPVSHIHVLTYWL